MEIMEYKKMIKQRLSEKRYNHSINVAKSAVELSKKYGADPYKAEIAGILHDITKEETLEEHLKMFEKYSSNVDDITSKAVKLMHAKSGADFIKFELGITDTDILDAVSFHTTAKANMTVLQKVIYIADFISEERDYSGVNKMREFAKEDLDIAVYEGLAFSINDLVSGGKAVHIDTINAFNHYCLNENFKKRKPSFV